jgi:hypothetical protein
MRVAGVLGQIVIVYLMFKKINIYIYGQRQNWTDAMNTPRRFEGQKQCDNLAHMT